ncbi:IS21 family transposase [Azospirillum thermophilum]|uniref:IS21 family transposase n=1 Tax=Azospirillum thermophilum TaxID=2202148 RepID=A0A2S2D0S6_9PROT|nr:IS21 family transposase [Azospirillum thermophilum]AWK85845.1 IS21 family transposase [Azospirillum thermophilum]AWK90295.1 IS21 family transposase [Azospirillum thermophilum]
MVTLGELVMILDLARQGLSVSAIARRTGRDRKTVRKYIERGLEPPAYKPRQPAPSLLRPFEAYLRERVARFPELTGRRLWREVRDLGFTGGYSTVTEFLRTVRPPPDLTFERRFETPTGKQAQVDFAFFKTTFTDEPGAERVVWLFSLVLGHSRMMWGRFVPRQDLATVLRCHVAAFDALGGVPEQILYDRMKTAVLGEVDEKGIAYNAKLLALAAHYGFLPKACKPYRAKTKGKVERPFRYVREDFFLARSFRSIDDLNAQFAQWLDQVANRRVHGTTGRIVAEHFAEERLALKPLPAGPYTAVLGLDRRITKDGMVSVGGNLYSVPDGTRRRSVEVQLTANEVHILEDGRLIAAHPVQEGRGKRRIAEGHRTLPPPSNSTTPRQGVAPPPSTSDVVTPRSLAIYDAIARRLADGEVAR